MTKKEYAAAIDMTGPFSSWCIADLYEKVIIEEKSIKISRKSNSLFFNSFKNTLNELKINIQEIKNWYVGVGPGSYTGIRVGASFVSGILYSSQENIKITGVPSFFPIAAEVSTENNGKTGVVFQVTPKSLLIYSVYKRGGVLNSLDKPLLVNEENAEVLLEEYSKVVTLQDLKNNLLAKGALKDKIICLNSFPVRRMFDKECCTNSNNIEDLIYIRPAVTAAVNAG
ncbi:MAG: hypothetical protein K9M56_01525 [Victivallales bacterium]|nr:hypothetical protein [Victivallales bacterium]